MKGLIIVSLSLLASLQSATADSHALKKLGEGYCRDEKGKSGKYYKEKHTSFNDCKNWCADNSYHKLKDDQQCYGFEYQEESETCEIHYAPIAAYKKKDDVYCYWKPSLAPETPEAPEPPSGWEYGEGYCRDEDGKSGDYWKEKDVSWDQCYEWCIDGTYHKLKDGKKCYGYEYQASKKICEIHYEPLKTYKEKDGIYCYWKKHDGSEPDDTPPKPPSGWEYGEGYCRDEDGKSGKYWKEKDVSWDQCYEWCIDGTYHKLDDDEECYGYEYQASKKICEIHYEPLKTYKKKDGIYCYWKKHTPSMPSVPSGWKHGEGYCRDENGKKGKYYKVKGASFEKCDEWCTNDSYHKLGDKSCTGYEYQSDKKICEIHYEPLKDYDPKDGVYCRWK